MRRGTVYLPWVIVLIVLGVSYFIWMWFFCRFYVGPNQMAIVIAKTGKPLPPGQILAGEGYQGVQERVLGEGRHFLNPFLYDYKIMEVLVIPPGKVGVVTSKVGENLPEGEFLANPGQKGIWRNVLGPGKYRLNPVGYSVEIVDAVSIPIGYVGVLTSLAGKQAPEGAFASKGEKGIRKEVLQPGLYYINPREFKVDVLEIGVNQVSLLGKRGGQVVTKSQIAASNTAIDDLQRNILQQQVERRADYLSQSKLLERAPAPERKERYKKREVIPSGAEGQAIQPPPQMETPAFILNQFVEFPSRDGFEISLDMTVEFELSPKNIASIMRAYGDLPAAVEKVILPQILSISRLKGSAYGARDFIEGEGREKFQNDLTDALKKSLEEKNILVHSALIRHVNVPMQILEPIQQASLAIEQDLTNKERQNTARKQAQLNTELSLIEQRREQVAQETEKLKAEIRAEQEKLVAQLRAETARQVAEIEKQTAMLRAEKTLKLGKASADILRMIEGERAKGFQLRASAFGSAHAYNLWTLAQKLPDNLRVAIIHAGEGTLWTDLKNATIGELGAAQWFKLPSAEEKKIKPQP